MIDDAVTNKITGSWNRKAESSSQRLIGEGQKPFGIDISGQADSNRVWGNVETVARRIRQCLGRNRQWKDLIARAIHNLSSGDSAVWSVAGLASIPAGGLLEANFSGTKGEHLTGRHRRNIAAL